MTVEAIAVTQAQCEEWREACRNGATPYELATESGVTRGAVIHHVSGECRHEGGYSILLSRYSVTADECEELRRQFADREAIESVLETSGRRWSTVVRHLTGECSHDVRIDAPVATKEALRRHDRITEEDCERFRRGVREAGSVMEFAASVDAEYQSVLVHVNGDCSHETTTPPRKPDGRRKAITKEECREIRDAFRSDPGVQRSALSERYGCSKMTIERHVRFRCSHPPVDALVTDVEEVRDLLDGTAETD